MNRGTETFHFKPPGFAFGAVLYLILGAMCLFGGLAGMIDAVDMHGFRVTDMIVAVFGAYCIWRGMRPILEARDFQERYVIGPEGIEWNVQLRQPIPWAEIASIQRHALAVDPLTASRGPMLMVKLTDDAKPQFRSPLLDWRARRWGGFRRLPIHLRVREGEDALTLAIRRYHPVER